MPVWAVILIWYAGISVMIQVIYVCNMFEYTITDLPTPRSLRYTFTIFGCIVAILGLIIAMPILYLIKFFSFLMIRDYKKEQRKKEMKNGRV